jgi:hypothetical protein
MTEKKDYTDFDRFITGKMKSGKLYIDMSEIKLKEALKELGIRRVATYDDSGRKYVNNAYPKQSQIDHVKMVMQRTTPRQETIDKSIFYSKETKRKGNYYHAKDIVYYKDKIYTKGQFLPKRYIDE